MDLYEAWTKRGRRKGARQGNCYRRTDGGTSDNIDAKFVLNDRLENSQVYRNAANEKNGIINKIGMLNKWPFKVLTSWQSSCQNEYKMMFFNCVGTGYIM